MEESTNKKIFPREERNNNYSRSDRDNRIPREKQYKGYYVDVTKSGGDAIRAFRKLKRMYKDTKFFEQMRERECYIKPSARKREAQKERKKVLRRLQREHDDNRFMGVKRSKK
jgi:ribosomal protein S21